MEGTLALRIARLENHIRLMEKQEELVDSYTNTNTEFGRERLRLKLHLYQLQQVLEQKGGYDNF